MYVDVQNSVDTFSKLKNDFEYTNNSNKWIELLLIFYIDGKIITVRTCDGSQKGYLTNFRKNHTFTE